MKTILKTFFILVFSASIGACNPMKVTDPAAPGFDPDKFSFSDYYDNKEMTLAEAYKILFPPGTPKEFVDRVLVKAGGGLKCLACLKIIYVSTGDHHHR